MPQIPINPQDLPTRGDRFEPMDESLSYLGEIEMIGEPRKDKNDHDFISLRIRVTEPEEFANRVLYDNYVSLPWKIEDWMDAKQRKAAEQSGDVLGDIARSAEIQGGPKGWNTDDLVNKTVSFTIKNEEYQGSLRSKPYSYLLRKDSSKIPF